MEMKDVIKMGKSYLVNNDMQDMEDKMAKHQKWVNKEDKKNKKEISAIKAELQLLKDQPITKDRGVLLETIIKKYEKAQKVNEDFTKDARKKLDKMFARCEVIKGRVYKITQS